jgi:hypothetical protein
MGAARAKDSEGGGLGGGSLRGQHATDSSRAKVTADSPEMIIVVDTPNGVYVRRVAQAIPLPEGIEPGFGAEEATHEAAAIWGLPDFVYRPILVRAGSSTRELGDRILLVGDKAVVIQVKSRQGSAGDQDREERWARTAIAKAVRQAKGTVRRLLASPVTLQNGRGREIEVAGADYRWLAVVVLDHNGLPDGLTIEHGAGDLPCVVLLRRDWDFLFGQLRSTYAVVQYLNRVAAMDARPLGEEPVRYYELAVADLAAPAKSIDPRILGKSGVASSVPILPQAPAGHDDRRAHRLLRVILEDIATTPISGEATEGDRIRVLAEIDNLPVAHRTALGQLLFEMMEQVMQAPDGQSLWRFRSFVTPDGRLQLGFGACTRFGPEIQGAFGYWVMLRHHQRAQDIGGAHDLVTVGVLLTPRYDGLRPWDTTMARVEGEIDLTAEELDRLLELWGNRP